MPEPTTQVRVALFDLDHTLLPLDSDYAWGQFTSSIGWTDTAEFSRCNEEFYRHYLAGTLDIAAYVRFATQALRQRGPAQAKAAHERFMAEVIAPALREGAHALLRAHRQAGDKLAIVTATNEFVTRPIAHALGVQDLIATELARDSSDWITGEIAGVPAFRAGKVTRVQQWLAAQNLNWSSTHTTFYTDSINDLPLLEQVTVPVATNPDARLLALAQQRNWRVLDLFKDN